MENSDQSTTDKYLFSLSKIKKANAFLTTVRKITQKEIVRLLNEKKDQTNKKDPIKESTYSAYVNASDFRSGINSGTACQLFLSLDDLIKSFGYQWDDSEKEYVSITDRINLISTDRHKALHGVWEVCSWDYNESTQKGVGYIHLFKLNIVDVKNVICTTGGTTFKLGEFYLIGIEKVCVELANPARKLVLILDIGSDEADAIANNTHFKLAYVDSGQFTVRAGAGLMRKSSFNYDEIFCGSKPAVDVEIEWPGIQEELKDKQYVISR